MLKTLFYTILLTSSAIAQASTKYADELVMRAKQEKLSEHRQWLKLLHYQKKFFGELKSDADSMNFFLAGQVGKTSPEEELSATIRAFFLPKVVESDKHPEVQHPQCQFPARYRWLKEKLNFDATQLQEQSCSRFNKFFQGLEAKSATIVFSSYYLNNPSSAFGHTMLRMNKESSPKTGKRYELLDYGISYAATVTVSNPVLYALYGIFGLFPGSLTSLPYYYKVREYNDFESRDLWEYEIELSQNQVNRLVEHIWELGSAVFNYYYLDENCSYFILTMIEAANPDLNLVRELPALVTPADTIRSLGESEGLIRKVHYRPAMRVQFAERIKHLSSEQLARLDGLTSSKKEEALSSLKSLKTADEKFKAEVLDAAMDFVDVKHSKELVEQEPKVLTWKQELLVARAEIPVRSKELNVPMPVNETPHLGHKAAKAGISYGSNTRFKNYLEGEFRFALHDLTDSSRGFPEFSQIEFMHTKLRYYFDEKNVSLDDFSFVRVLSLNPWNRYFKSISWKMDLGASKVHGQSCESCHKGSGSLGVGMTALPFGTKFLAVVPMVDLELAGSKGFEPTFFRLETGPSLMLRMSFSEDLKLLTSVNHHWFWPMVDTRQDHVWTATADFKYSFSKNWSTQSKFRLANREREWSAGVIRYF